MAGTCTSKMETSFGHLASMLAGFTQGVDPQLEEALRELPPHIIISTDSLGNRDFEKRVGGSPILVQEPGWEVEDQCFPGKWILMEGDITKVLFSSWTSRSSIEAILNENSLWTVTLTVPIEDGTPYKGCYWAAFWGVSLGRGEEGGLGFGGGPSEPDPRPEEVVPPAPEESPAPIARVEEEDEEV